MSDSFPVIDLPATGKRIRELREQLGFSVRDLQNYFCFSAPQAIYKWQNGEDLPSVDNLFALSHLFQVPINSLLVEQNKLPDNESGSNCFISAAVLPLFVAHYKAMLYYINLLVISQ